LLHRHEVTLSAKSDISHRGKLPATGSQSTDVRGGVPYRDEHRRAAESAAADIEGHSEAAKFRQPEQLSGIGSRSLTILRLHALRSHRCRCVTQGTVAERPRCDNNGSEIVPSDD